MGLKRILGTMLATRMAGRGGSSGLLGKAALIGALGGRRGGFGRKAGLAALGYLAYRAYRDRQSQTPGSTGSGDGGPESRFGGILGELADRFGFGSLQKSDGEPIEGNPTPEAEQAASRLSDERALLLIRAMITAANSDGTISPDERARILRQLDGAGADSEDRRALEREMKNPKPLDELLAQVNDQETAQEFYLASRAAVDAGTEPGRSYLLDLRQRLGLSDENAAAIEHIAP